MDADSSAAAHGASSHVVSGAIHAPAHLHPLSSASAGTQFLRSWLLARFGAHLSVNGASWRLVTTVLPDSSSQLPVVHGTQDASGEPTSAFGFEGHTPLHSVALLDARLHASNNDLSQKELLLVAFVSLQAASRSANVLDILVLAWHTHSTCLLAQKVANSSVALAPTIAFHTTAVSPAEDIAASLAFDSPGANSLDAATATLQSNDGAHSAIAASTSRDDQLRFATADESPMNSTKHLAFALEGRPASQPTVKDSEDQPSADATAKSANTDWASAPDPDSFDKTPTFAASFYVSHAQNVTETTTAASTTDQTHLARAADHAVGNDLRHTAASTTDGETEADANGDLAASDAASASDGATTAAQATTGAYTTDASAGHADVEGDAENLVASAASTTNVAATTSHPLASRTSCGRR